MTEEAPLIYVVTGEPSGDFLGGKLMAALKQRTGGKLRFAGIGGEHMAAEGMPSRVPLSELAIAGVVEVIPAARRIFRLVAETVADIERQRPVALVTIDSSGFTWRIAERLRRRGNPIPLIHYVAPMVWAWRAGRARLVARWYDHLMTLLPFEPPYFTKLGLSCAYVGHPVVEGGADRGDGAAFRRRHAVPSDAKLLTLLPGSRRGEVSRLLPIFAATVERVAQLHPRLRIVVPTVETVAEQVAAAVAAWRLPTIVLRGQNEKYDAFAASDVALAASGTVALELAMAKLPAVIAYRINAVTHLYVRRIVKVRYANLVNVILDREAVPELLQYRCTPERLAAAVNLLLDDAAARAGQIAACQEALQVLGYGGVSPSLRAADEVLAVIARKAKPKEDTMDTATDRKPGSAIDTSRFRLLHTMIRVLDLDRSIDFYCRLIGMKLLRKRPVEAGRYTNAFVGYGDDDANTVVELTYNWDQKEPYTIGSGFGHLAIGVSDLHATCAALQREGVKIPRPPGPLKFGTANIAFIEDPDGYKIELIERA